MMYLNLASVRHALLRFYKQIELEKEYSSTEKRVLTVFIQRTALLYTIYIHLNPLPSPIVIVPQRKVPP
jgi:hypothetical protein